MAYTQANLDTVKQALIDLGAGKRTVKVVIGGDSKEYAQVSLDKLRDLKVEIEEDLTKAAGTDSRYVHLTSSKGF